MCPKFCFGVCGLGLTNCGENGDKIIYLVYLVNLVNPVNLVKLAMLVNLVNLVREKKRPMPKQGLREFFWGFPNSGKPD